MPSSAKVMAVVGFAPCLHSPPQAKKKVCSVLLLIRKIEHVL